MTSTSIICVKKDVEQILEALSNFGEFHIEQTAQDNAGLTEYNQSIQKVEGSLADVNLLINQIVKKNQASLAFSDYRNQQKLRLQPRIGTPYWKAPAKKF